MMCDKSPETSINESSTNTDHQIAQSNSSEKVHPVDATNVIQDQQAIHEKAVGIPPSSRSTATEKSSDLTYVQQLNLEFETIALNNAQQQHETYFLRDGKWPRHSINVLCSHCQTFVDTRIETSTNPLTYLFTIVQFLYAFSLVVVPYCVPNIRKTTHYCPNCNDVLGEVDGIQ